MQYPIKTIDNSGSSADNTGLAALAAYTPAAYGQEVTLNDATYGTRKFIFCYTALTSLHQGSVVCIELDTADTTAGMNPRAVLPATSSVYLRFGVCAETVAAAGGIWVQVYGRCDVVCIDGTTDVAINDPLKAANASHCLVQDHADTGTASMIAISECAQTDTPTVQGDATYGDPTDSHQVYLLDRRATVA